MQYDRHMPSPLYSGGARGGSWITQSFPHIVRNDLAADRKRDRQKKREEKLCRFSVHPFRLLAALAWPDVRLSPPRRLERQLAPLETLHGSLDLRCDTARTLGQIVEQHDDDAALDRNFPSVLVVGHLLHDKAAAAERSNTNTDLHHVGELDLSPVVASG